MTDDINEFVASRLAAYGQPQTAVEAECFLWHAIEHITGGGLVLYRIHKEREYAYTILREAIARVQAQQLLELRRKGQPDATNPTDGSRGIK